MIADWFRRRAALVAELEETRGECVALAAERDELADRLARVTQERDAAWRLLAREETRPIPALPLSVRAEVARERARADQLAARLDVLQAANMRHDVPC